ncbi:DUF6882 domain-containing protein [Fusobacterium hwasookii]|uniref:Uncharacterized protein n=1 Tax=Fusobacterium hwasookii ChDC F128 TaxID=1216362 RepID=A0ABN0H2E8_9FUSO|nr:DUF6882 domain-containing protein [Fusobacterium hwasookii]EJU08475.1 hypothetical protein B437_00055 [Fusobacterium hwasookii ChDC F128]
MKKIGIIILLVFSFLLLTNCNKSKNEEVKNEKINFSKESYDLFEKFATDKKETIEKLKSLNKEEANNLYEEYQAQNNNTLYDIEDALAGFLDSIYNDTNGENFTDKDWSDANKILNKYDLELWDIGEGMVTIRELPHLYYDIFKAYVTDDYKEYLKIWAKDNEKLYQADAGLLVSFEEIGERIVTWESFLNQYPDTKLNIKVTALLNSYREDYLLGMDNTPTLDGGYDNIPVTVDEVAKKEYDRFMKKYPNSPTVELIKYLLENYQNNNIYDLIRKKILNEFELDLTKEALSKSLGRVLAIQDNFNENIFTGADWTVNLDDNTFSNAKEKYPIEFIGTAVLKENGETIWIWEDSSLVMEIQATAGNNAIPILTYNSFELPENMSENAFVSLACGILYDKIAFSGIDYTEKGGMYYFVVSKLPETVFSPVGIKKFADITELAIKNYNIDHKIFIENFLDWNKTKYEWQGNSIIADFGKEDKLEIQFEKIEDEYRIKEIIF